MVGSGWRAEYFLRAARDYKEEFEVAWVLCRSEEKAKLISEKFGVPTTTKEEDIDAAKPDFIVVSVSREASWKIASKWKKKGFCVMVETPMGNTLQ